MTRDDIIRMAARCQLVNAGNREGLYMDALAEFAELVAEAEREKVAQWMMQRSYATGHGDTTEDLLAELAWQIQEQWERIEVAEREVCAQICDYEWGTLAEKDAGIMFAEAIRARKQA